MSHSSTPFDRQLDADQQALFDTISGRFREIDAAFNAIASEIFLHTDAGTLGRELSQRLGRDLGDLAADVEGLASDFDGASRGI